MVINMTFNISSSRSSGVVRTYGGELVSFLCGGIEYVWQGDPAHWNGQAPILFPVCCAARDNKISFGGAEYPMPKHGIARKREFDPIYVSKSKVVLEQRESEETLTMFPFCYSLKAEYSVTDTGFRAQFTVKNLDKNEMTFCIGGHPGFNVPLTKDDGGFEDHKLVFGNAEGCTVSVTKGGYMDPALPKIDRLNGTNELPLVYSDYDNDCMIVEKLPKKSVSLISNKTGKGFRFDFDGFDALGIWTPIKKNSPFICLEPWNGTPASVDETTDAKSKKYSITLQPDEEYTVGYGIEIIR